MQPQNQATAPAPAGNSDPNYNFIFNNEQSKKRFHLPGRNNLTKLAILVVAGGAVLGILIIALSIFFGPKINTKELTDVIARSEEISRVSDMIVHKSRDLNTANLATTTSTALTSNESQINAYLKKNHKIVNVKDAKIYLNKNTDSEVQSADQNNHLSEYYYSYLKKSLTDYQTALKTAYDTASGPALKSMVQDYSLSTKTILNAGQLATTASQ
jgi:hypothetical protein